MDRQPTPRARRLARRRAILSASLPAVLLAWMLAGGAPAALAGAPGPAPSAAGVAGKLAAPASSQPRASRPAWAALTVAQQKALAPLRATWPTLSEARKRKWLVLARNFDDLSPTEQATLHSRMAEWAALSPQQRSQARLNFGEAQQLPEQDRRAAWEAYRALPDEEKRKLAAALNPPTPPTAAASRPVPADRLAPVPRTGSEIRAARIEAPAAAPVH